MNKSNEKPKEYIYKIYIESHEYESFMVRMTFAGIEDLLLYPKRWITVYKYQHDPEPNYQILLFINRIRYIKLLGEAPKKK